MRKTLKVIIAVIVVILLIVGGIFAYKFISNSMKIKNTEEKLSQINAQEFEDKLIEELKKTKLNVNTSNISTNICSWEEMSNLEQFVVIPIELFYSANKQDNPYEESISAYITSNSEGTVAIPLFKIESDNNGKFKKITYTERALKENIVPSVIEKVLKNEYDIDMLIVGNTEYNTRFNKLSNSDKGTIYCTENFLNEVLDKMQGRNNSSYVESYKEYSTTIFGLDIK